MADRLYSMTRRLAELVGDAVGVGDVLVGVVPEVVDDSVDPQRYGVVPTTMQGSSGLAHGQRSATATGVTSVPELGWTVFFPLATAETDAEAAYKEACEIAGKLLAGLEGRELDDACGPLELRTYLALDEARSTTTLLWRQDWVCSRMGWT